VGAESVSGMAWLLLLLNGMRSVSRLWL
jgi:hypothetical protein